MTVEGDIRCNSFHDLRPVKIVITVGRIYVRTFGEIRSRSGFLPDGNRFRKGGDNRLIANNKNPSSGGCGKRYMELKIDFGSGGGA